MVIGTKIFFDNVEYHTCEVEPFDPTIINAKQAPIFDALILYSLKYTHKTYQLMVLSTLHVNAMDNNLLPKFILR